MLICGHVISNLYIITSRVSIATTVLLEMQDNSRLRVTELLLLFPEETVRLMAVD